MPKGKGHGPKKKVAIALSEEGDLIICVPKTAFFNIPEFSEKSPQGEAMPEFTFGCLGAA